MGKIKDSGAQDVSLEKPGCVYKDIAMHELLHALGFAHEQTRPDRDRYVKIYQENIISGNSMHLFGKLNESRFFFSGQEHNFQRYTTSEINTLGEAYDYGKQSGVFLS